MPPTGALTRVAVAVVHRANAQQPKLFVGMILILIFAEALALYGLIGEFSTSALGTWACSCWGGRSWRKQRAASSCDYACRHSMSCGSGRGCQL